MSLKVGIVGLPNVGKSTLFNAMLKRQQALVANYPFATIEPNVGIVDVPDDRLNKLADVTYRSEKVEPGFRIVPATVQFIDIAGLVKDSHKGEGLGNQFLAHIREVDLILHVVRAFSDPNIIRSSSTNPDDDIVTVNTELLLADLSAATKMLESAKTEAKGGEKSAAHRATGLEKIVQALQAGFLAWWALW